MVVDKTPVRVSPGCAPGPNWYSSTPPKPSGKMLALTKSLYPVPGPRVDGTNSQVMPLKGIGLVFLKPQLKLPFVEVSFVRGEAILL